MLLCFLECPRRSIANDYRQPFLTDAHLACARQRGSRCAAEIVAVCCLAHVKIPACEGFTLTGFANGWRQLHRKQQSLSHAVPSHNMQLSRWYKQSCRSQKQTVCSNTLQLPELSLRLDQLAGPAALRIRCTVSLQQLSLACLDHI